MGGGFVELAGLHYDFGVGEFLADFDTLPLFAVGRDRRFEHGWAKESVGGQADSAESVAVETNPAEG